MDASNVMLVVGQGKAFRVQTKVLDGRRVRVFATTVERVPDPVAS